MKRRSLALALIAFASCGGDAPRPAAPPSIAETQPAPPAPAPAPPPEPVKPPAPQSLDITIPATTATVKLVSAGKGKKAKLALAPKAGDKQKLELAMDFAATQGPKEALKSQVLPTMVLTGDAEVKTTEPSGITYGLVVSGTDARDVPGAQIPAGQIKQVLATLAGLTIDGTVAPNGAVGPIGMHLMTADPTARSALELVRLAIPGWPVLPAEPIGVGAKWQVTSTARVADKLEVSMVTTYELTAHTGAAWTIKGMVKVTGADQTLEGGKITDISGSGTIDATVTEGTLYPVYKSTVETRFTAIEAGKDKPEVFDLIVGGAVAIK